MYILVEKVCHNKRKQKRKRRKIIHDLENLWLSKYPFAIFEWMYLTVFSADYPNGWLAAAALPTAITLQTQHKSERVDIYRVTSLMLTSLWSLFLPPWVSMATVIPTKVSWEEAEPNSVHEEEKLYNEHSLRWVGGGVRWNGTRESRPGGVAVTGGVSFWVSLPTSQMCIVRAAVALQGSNTAPSDPTRRRRTGPTPRRHEGTRVKALALSGNSWLEGMVAADWCGCGCGWCCCCGLQSLENRHIYLLYIAYVAAWMRSRVQVGFAKKPQKQTNTKWIN